MEITCRRRMLIILSARHPFARRGLRRKGSFVKRKISIATSREKTRTTLRGSSTHRRAGREGNGRLGDNHGRRNSSTGGKAREVGRMLPPQ